MRKIKDSFAHSLVRMPKKIRMASNCHLISRHIQFLDYFSLVQHAYFSTVVLFSVFFVLLYTSAWQHIRTSIASLMKTPIPKIKGNYNRRKAQSRIEDNNKWRRSTRCWERGGGMDWSQCERLPSKSPMFISRLCCDNTLTYE